MLAGSAGANFSGAADLTERLVLEHGVDYRSAYRATGRAVVVALADGRGRLRPDDLRAGAAAVDVALPDDAVDAVATLDDVGALVSGRDVVGGSAPSRIADHFAAVRATVSRRRDWAAGVRRTARDAEEVLVATARALADGAPPVSVGGDRSTPTGERDEDRSTP